MYWCPEVCIYTRNLPESEKYIWIIQNLKSLDSFILASRDNWVSCKQKLGCLRLYGYSRVSRAQPRINAFSRHNRFAETHSHLQLSYHITDRLLAAGNKENTRCIHSWESILEIKIRCSKNLLESKGYLNSLSCFVNAFLFKTLITHDIIHFFT